MGIEKLKRLNKAAGFALAFHEDFFDDARSTKHGKSRELTVDKMPAATSWTRFWAQQRRSADWINYWRSSPAH